MVVKPFRFALKKLTAAEVRLAAAVQEFLPLQMARPECVEAVERVLTKHLGESAILRLERVETDAGQSVVKGLPQSCVVAVIGLPPHKSKLFVQIDPQSAAQIIDRVLGGASKSGVGLHAPTETEQGVLQYLIMQVLAAVHQLCGGADRMHFRFERFYCRPDDVSAAWPSGADSAVLTYHLQWGDRGGAVELIFPRPFVEAAMAQPLVLPRELHARERAHLVKRLRAFDWVRTAAWVEAGMSALTSEEVAGLEPGDVVLLDESEVRLVEHRLQGEVTLRVGSSLDRGIRATVVEGTQLRVQLRGME